MVRAFLSTALSILQGTCNPSLTLGWRQRDCENLLRVYLLGLSILFSNSSYYKSVIIYFSEQVSPVLVLSLILCIRAINSFVFLLGHREHWLQQAHILGKLICFSEAIIWIFKRTLPDTLLFFFSCLNSSDFWWCCLFFLRVNLRYQPIY